MQFKLLASMMLSFFLCTNAWADMVELKNGDKLSGEIKLVKDNDIYMETTYSGLIKIDSKKIKTFTINTPVKIKKNLYSRMEYVDGIKSAEENSIELVKQDKKQKVKLNKELIILKDIKKDIVTSDLLMDGFFNFGLYFNQEKTKTVQYDGSGNFKIRHDLWRHNLYGTLKHTEEDDKVKTYYYTSQYDIDRFVSSSFYWQGTASYRYDWVANLRQKMSMGLGPGWQIWEDELSGFSLTGLVNYQLSNYKTTKNLENPTGAIKWNYYQFFAGKDIKLLMMGQIGRSFNNDITFDFATTVGLSYKLTRWLSLNGSATHERTNTIDGKTNRLSYVVGIGINW